MDIVTFCHFLSYSVILSSLIVKVPQIISVLNAKNTKGLSLSSVLLEEVGYSIMLTYSFAMGYPLASYFEYTVLVLQDFILIVAVLHFDGILKMKTIPVFLLYFLVYTGIAFRWFPDIILTAVISLVTPLSFTSKLAQIKLLYTSKNPGQVSLMTWCIVTYGATARILTSFFLTGDFGVILNFTVAASMNMTISCMIFYYRQLAKDKKE
ncbi:solute carrier family 66 member 3-like [Saccostrea echinata]|uniref:solute carrier family 66 member 3-like n=1 Tax=Saccostrea echinata TaxID=191078 RepID=UPI002A83E3DD|nr:solute carrier family 66 member 3-like [Saccostrea echinata]